jgi:hypothetical protein
MPLETPVPSLRFVLQQLKNGVPLLDVVIQVIKTKNWKGMLLFIFCFAVALYLAINYTDELMEFFRRKALYD